MAKETVEELQVEHSRLCALASDNGVTLSDDLTAEFDTALVGRAINASIGKLLAEAGITDAGVAKDSETVQDVPAPKKKKAKAATKKTQTDADASQENEPMATTPKKTKAKKATKKVAKKTAKKATAKKAVAGTKKGAKKKGGPRADSMTSKIIAKMKNGGITRAEVLKMTGWKAVSMQQLAGNAGVTLKVSDARPFTYTCK